MQGRIIEYIEQGKFICAVVISESGRRLHLLNQNGREVNLPEARVLHQTSQKLPASMARSEILQILQETAESRKNLELPVSLHDIWQLVSEEKSLHFSPAFLADLCFGGEADDNQVAAFLRAVFNDKLYFRYKSGEVQVHTPEAVEQLIARQEQERRQELLLAEGATALKRLWAGEEVDIPQDCLDLLHDYYLFDKEAENFLLARELLKRSGLNGPHDVFHLLVKAGRWTEHENIPLLRYQLPVDFSDEAMAQTEEIVKRAETGISTANCRDLRDLAVLTIDGASTRDFDDALHVIKQPDGNFEVGIHVSDVARYIAPGTPLFREAEARTTSLYFPDGMVPMLPSQLSEGALSLLAGQDRAAVSFLASLSPQGELLNYSVVRSVIRVKRQLSYDAAEEQLPGDADLRNLVMLSQRLLANRIEAGALLIPIPDVVISFAENGKVQGVNLVAVDSTMRLMVAEFMVLANTLAARFLAERQEPGLYRSQSPARKRFFKQPDDDLFIKFLQRRFLSRGNLNTTPSRHDGVGVDQYTTTTSPIRRLLDLVIQHQLTSILAGQGSKFREPDLNGFANLITAAQSRINLVRQQRHRYWLLKYLESLKGEHFPAFVLNKQNYKVQVVLKDFLLEGELPANQGVRHEPGDNIMVKLAAASALDLTFRLEW